MGIEVIKEGDCFETVSFYMFIKLRLPFRVSKSHHNNAYHEHAVTKGNGAFTCG